MRDNPHKTATYHHASSPRAPVRRKLKYLAV
uniref:Uncharacterized protein n=1 Tax=Arundo donax TaxID=35708 RepID=A0A0A8ZLU0_ARUDO